MVAQPTIKSPLNDTQLMLLKLFSRPMSPVDLESIRNMLLEYYETLLQKEVDRVIEAKGISRANFDQVLSNDQRTK